MPQNARSEAGLAGERHAARHLHAAGYRLLERNFRTRFGELDIVATRGDRLVFCEVRARVRAPPAGVSMALESIGPEKRRRLRAMARQWLAARPGAAGPAADVLRFDAIGVALDARGNLLALEHVEDAF